MYLVFPELGHDGSDAALGAVHLAPVELGETDLVVVPLSGVWSAAFAGRDGFNAHDLGAHNPRY